MAVDKNDYVKELNIMDETEKLYDHENSNANQVPEVLEIDNEENAINYTNTRRCWNQVETTIDNAFVYNVALEIMEEDLEPRSIGECCRRDDWPKWKDTIQSELDSLAKREVFGLIVQTLEGVKPVGYKWIFMRKINEIQKKDWKELSFDEKRAGMVYLNI